MRRTLFLLVLGCSFLTGVSQTLVRGKIDWCKKDARPPAGIEISLLTSDSVLHRCVTDSAGEFFLFIPGRDPGADFNFTYNGEALNIIIIPSDTLVYAGYKEHRYLICAEEPVPLAAAKNATTTKEYNQRQLYLFGVMRGDKREGDWLSFYQNGMLWSVGTYKDGKRQGHAATFYDSGKKSSEGFYKNDKMVGNWKFWDEAGNVTEQDFGE